MKIEENVNIGPFNGEYTIMVSSSVNGFETQLNLIFTYLTQLGFKVVMSKEGTLKVSPRLGSFGSCLKAAEDCDLFFGIIRKNCGTGRMDECSITFEEFKRARKCGKPCWYIIDEDIKVARMLLIKKLEMREYPRTKNKFFNKCISMYYDFNIRMRKSLPKVLQLYKPDKSHYFDEECFAMEDFVNQKEIKNRAEVSNNWMQYCDFSDWTQIKRFLDTNFNDKPFIDLIMKGV